MQSGIDPILVITGDEQSRVDESLADAGLPPAVGVSNFCIFRASRDAPELSDGRGWTYHHHIDMACWRGRLYVGWNSCERDEDIWPARELFSTSENGIDWSPPAELFPQGISTCLRMYFFLAPNRRMLAIAGLRADTGKTNEDKKGGLVVREIRADHTLGEVFTLQTPPAQVPHPRLFDQSPDAGFIEACRSLLADTIYLEQQDRGRLLGDRGMKWHHAAHWPGGRVPGDSDKWVSGKAFTFFRRPDGAVVGISKMGWTTISFDEGKTWRQPEVPPSLVTGKAKVFAQQTEDGRFALAYNPSRRNRYPLAIVTGDDGIRFGNMRLVHGELPIQRYAGADRSIGPQYTRGISHWADDGTRRGEGVMWLVYSMSKEDIWVSRVPLPVAVDAPRAALDEGLGHWNLYQPKWSRIDVSGGELILENRDPYDYAVATRVLDGDGSRVAISFDLRPMQSSRREFGIDMLSKFGSKRPVRIVLRGGSILIGDGEAQRQIGTFSAGEWLNVSIDADAVEGSFKVSIDGNETTAAFVEPADVLHRITFRTGEFRGIGGKKPVEAGTDKPVAVVRYAIRALSITR